MLYKYLNKEMGNYSENEQKEFQIHHAGVQLEKIIGLDITQNVRLK